MLYLLSERSAAKLRKLLGDADALVPATPGQTRRTRPDVPPIVGGAKDRGLFRLVWRDDSTTAREHVLFVQPGAYIVGRTAYSVADETDLGEDFTGWVSLMVTLGSTPTASVVGGVDPFEDGKPSGNVSYVPLWYIDEDGTATDYRATPTVQAWE